MSFTLIPLRGMSQPISHKDISSLGALPPRFANFSQKNEQMISKKADGVDCLTNFIPEKLSVEYINSVIAAFQLHFSKFPYQSNV
ncbi:hypothetical protein [Neobacillus drentensis]|uniref:hypothetical protein n=1 Tax=Neobacillus drentensis TaxID=220684 RepID=UPI0030009349